jgi:hypothetical protein
VRLRLASAVLIGGAAVATAFAGAAPAGAAAAPCKPRVSTVQGHRAIAYCGPATAVLEIGGRTYSFQHGLCDRSATMGGVELNIGTLVQGAAGNAGRPFISMVIAESPSESEAFEADAGGHLLIPDSVIVPGGTLFGQGTFSPLLGPPFSGSWNCHGVIYSGA